MNHFFALLILSLAPLAAQADEPTSCPPGQMLILDMDQPGQPKICFPVPAHVAQGKCKKGQQRYLDMDDPESEVLCHDVPKRVITPMKPVNCPKGQHRYWNADEPESDMICVANTQRPASQPTAHNNDCNISHESLRELQRIQRSAKATLESLRKITSEESSDAQVSRWVLNKDGAAGRLIQDAFTHSAVCGKLTSEPSGQIDIAQAQKSVQCLRRAFRPLAGYNSDKKDIASLLTEDEKAKIKNQQKILVGRANLFLNQSHKFATESLVPSGAGNCLASKPESTENSDSVNRKPAVEPVGGAQ